MTSNDIKQIRDAFARLSKGCKIVEFKHLNTIRIDTDYKSFDGDEIISFYAYVTKPSKKIYISDAGRVFKQLSRSNQEIQDGVLQTLVESYGLVLLEDSCIVDQQDIPLHDRIAAILQIQIGVDAMVRTWIGYAKKIKLKEGKDGNSIPNKEKL